MATEFDNWFSDGAWSGLAGLHGEPVVYYPKTGGARSIIAIVDRDPPSVLNPAGNTSIPNYLIRVANDCKQGISSHELNTGGDEIGLLEKVGDRVRVRHSLMVLMSQNAGVCQIGVR